MGTAFRNPGQIVGFPCISASVVDGSVLVQVSGTDDQCQLPASVPVTSGVIGVIRGTTTSAASSSAPQSVDIVINGFYPGVAAASITRGNALVANSTAGDLRPYNSLTDSASQIVAVAIESVNSGDRVGMNILPNYGSLGLPLQAGAFHSVRGVHTSNIAALASFTVADTTLPGGDGLTYIANDRILLVGQTTASQNGIYIVGTVAAGVAPLTRAADFLTGQTLPAEVLVSVSEGTDYAHSIWRLLSQGSSMVIDTTSLSFGLAADASVGVIPTARCVATSAITIATALVTGQTIDGVTLVAGDRVLVVNQATAAQNGMYIAQASPVAGTFAPDWVQGAVKAGVEIKIGPEGTTWKNSTWRSMATQVSTGGYLTVGTTDPVFYPRMQTLSHALSAGTYTDNVLPWVYSATLSTVTAIDTTAANAVKVSGLVAGKPGTGTIVLTGTTTDVIQYSVFNF